MIIKIQIDKLTSHMGGHRTKAQIEYVRNMVTFGFVPTIQIDKNYKVIDGNHRVAICKELGITEIYAEIVKS